MNIKTMHTTFRTIGQQMGMQLTRAITSEDIDTFINYEINEIIRTELLNNANIEIQNKVLLNSSDLVPINLFRTLFKSEIISIKKIDFSEDGSLKYIDFENHILFANNNCVKILVPTSHIYNEFEYLTINPLLYLSVVVNYKNNVSNEKLDKSSKCRIIPLNLLNNTFEDYLSKPDINNPICTISSNNYNNGGIIKENDLITIYTKETEYDTILDNLMFSSNRQNILENNKIFSIKLDYIKQPNIVKYDEDETKCVNCDLPEYIHYRIVEGAVKKYLVSINEPKIINNQ